MRGSTSCGCFLRASDVPADPARRDAARRFGRRHVSDSKVLACAGEVGFSKTNTRSLMLAPIARSTRRAASGNACLFWRSQLPQRKLIPRSEEHTSELQSPMYL